MSSTHLGGFDAKTNRRGIVGARPNGGKVYVSSNGASTVSVIDTATDRIVAAIDVGANPHGLAVSGDGRRVLVSG